MPLHGIFKGIDTSASAMSAERLRMTVASENLANAGNTKPEENGLPYARQRVHFSEVLDRYGKGTGKVEAEVTQEARYRTFYDPAHPHADPETGMVTESDIDPVLELTDLMIAGKAYEANANAVKGLMNMHQQALRLGER